MRRLPLAVVLVLSACTDPPEPPPGPPAEPAAPAPTTTWLLSCAAAADCDGKTGVGSTCFQRTCQPPPVGPRYWGPSQEASTAPKTAYTWSWSNATTLQRAAPITAVALTGGAAMVADGPFFALHYAAGTTDFAALELGSGKRATDTDALDLGASNSTTNVPLTVSAFVSQSAATPADGTWDTVLALADLAQLDVQASTGAVRFGVWSATAAAWSTFETPAGALRKGEWHQVRATYRDSAPYTVSIYVDERLVAAGVPSRGAMDRARHANQKYTIGFGAAEPASFHGRIAGAWVVRALMPPLASEARLRAAFAMDGPFFGVQNGANKYTLQAIAHAKVPDNNVMFYGSPQTLDAPVIDRSNPVASISAKVFDTQVALAGQYKDPDMLGAHLKGLTQATYEAWFKRTIDTGALEYVLLSQNGYAAISASDQLVCGFADLVGPTVKPIATGTTAIALGRWYHLACSFDGLTTRAWLDGKLEGTSTVGAGTPGYYAAGAGQLYLGAYLPSSMRGRITGVRVWDRARAPDAGCATLCDSDDVAVPGTTVCYDTAAQAASSCSAYRTALPRCQAAAGNRCEAASSPDQPCYYDLLWPPRVSTCGDLGGSGSCAQTCTASTSCGAACTTYAFDPDRNANLATATTCARSGGSCSSLGTGGVTGTVSSEPMSTYDPQAVGLPSRPDMTLSGGRLSNVILTRYLEYPADTDGTASKSVSVNGPLRFTASCTDWQDDDGGINPSSLSMILVVRDESGAYLTTFYGGNLGGVEHRGVTSGPFRYTLYAYSNRLNTARCDISMHNGPVTTSLFTQRHIGGTMIRVGPFPDAGDRFEVQTLHGAVAYDDAGHVDLNERTRMVLFSVAGDPTGYLAQAPLRSAPVAADTDDDARITVPSTSPDYRPTATTFPFDKPLAGYPAGNFLLVGKATNDPAPAGTGKRAVLRADVVHTPGVPLIVTGTATGATFSPRPLAPGRYTVGIEARVSGPIGELVPNGPNPLSYDGSSTLVRGRFNGKGFDYEIRCGTGPGTPASPLRRIPVGAFGSYELHRFYQDIEITTATTCWPVVSNPVADLVIGPTWFAQRNADAAQLGVAMLNMGYGDAHHCPYFGSPGADPLAECIAHCGVLDCTPLSLGVFDAVDDNEYSNTGDLLGPRGEPGTVAGGQPDAFADPDVRGPFQWNADVVGLTEFGSRVASPTSAGNCELELDVMPPQVQHFYDAVRPGDSRRWAHMWGYDERFQNFDGAGAIFVAETQWPTSSLTSLAPAFDPALWTEGRGNGACQSRSLCDANTALPWNMFSCTTDDETTFTDTAYIPTRIAVRTILSEHQPILVLSMHPWSGDGSADVESRETAFHSMSTMLIHQLAGSWGALNRTPAGATEQSPGNRIIFIGDSNLETTPYGEHYALLRELRNTWGYAIDLASAVDNSHGLGLTTHNAGDAACTNGVDNVAIWEGLPDSVRWAAQLAVENCNQPALLQFAWWGRSFFRYGTTAKTDGGGRYTVVLLIGRGWEMDDPARAYSLLQRADVPPNPFSPTGKGVNTWSQGVAGGGPGNYQPRASVHGGGTTVGAGAIETDHTAVGGRLRIWAGLGAR